MRKGCIFFAFVAFLNPSVAFIRCSSSFSRPLRVAYLSFFDEVFSESFATATPDVSTAELSSILPLAALGATLAVSKTAYKQRDGLRKNLNATEATLISKRKQVIAAGKKANVR